MFKTLFGLLLVAMGIEYVLTIYFDEEPDCDEDEPTLPFTVRVFYGRKIVTEEAFEAANRREALRVADLLALELAEEMIPDFMWTPSRVSFVLLSGHVFD